VSEIPALEHRDGEATACGVEGNTAASDTTADHD
jgi:hypothetical protein